VVLLLSGCGGSIEDTVAKARDSGLTPAERCNVIRDLADEGPRGVAPLGQLAADPDAQVAKCAKEAIATIDDPRAAKALEGLLASADPGVLVSAADALGNIGKPASTPSLVSLLTSPNRRVVLAAVQALDHIGDPSAVPALDEVALRRGATRAEERASRKVRKAAVVALGDIGDAAARPTLVRVLSTDPVASRDAGTALARIYEPDVTPLLPLLEKKSNIALAFGLVDVGQKGTEDALVTALHRYGDLELAEYYLNCGNDRLESAAVKWAGNHGYTVFTQPGVGGGQWGSGP
jgi:HEAT repeat protein